MHSYKILHLTQFSEIGGGETALLSLVQNIDKKKFEVGIAVPKKGALSQKLKRLKIKFFILNLNPYLIRTFFVPGLSPLGIYELKKLTDQFSPNLIHVNHLSLAAYAGIIAKLHKIPVVATAHGPWDSYYFYQDITTNFFVDKILANSHSTAQKLSKRKIIPKEKIEIIPFGIDTKILKPAISKVEKRRIKKLFNLPTGDQVVTIIGRLDPIKDHLTYLEAAKLTLEKFPQTTFFIVGSKHGDFTNKKNNYLSLINNYLKSHRDLSRKVIFSGFIDNMPKAYQATDILVSSSLSESFGITLAEAAASGLPIVATNAGGQKNIVKENKNGFLTPPKRPDLLAQKILILAKNPKLRRQFGINGRLHIIKNFTIEKYIKSVENTYLTLLKNRQK